MKNNYFSKAIRTITSVLPVKGSRNGSCKQCGECCKLPSPCIFLGYGKEGKAVCKLYKFRLLNCRKYPRSEREHITMGGCGFYFEDD